MAQLKIIIMCMFFDEFRLESYSCKMAGTDKRLFKDLVSESGLAPGDLQALSPPVSLVHVHSPSR